MLNVAQGKEIVLHVKNDMGILGEIARLVSERGVSIKAVSGSVEEDICTLRLITDDNLRTCDILHEHAYTPMEEQVVLLEVPHKPGMLKKMTQRLGEEGIDVRHLYATASEKDAHCLIVLRTTNDARAIVALSEFVAEYA
ncbi:MAG: hypothetical protein ACP5I4_07135 [Oceanipulchritudo sp.]